VPVIISSRQHALVKRVRALARDGGVEVLLDGWHLVDEALDATVPLDLVAVTGERSEAEARVLARAVARGARVHHVTRAVMDALSPVRSPTGVVAIARRPAHNPDAVLEPAPALVPVGLGIQDPGNVGALIRSAAASGATGVVFDTDSADPWGWKALRASMGSGFRLPVARVQDVPALVEAWRTRGIKAVAAVPREGTPMYTIDFARPTALLLGGEGSGLPDGLAARADGRVTIPMTGRIESLNVAAAAAVLLYEARRQREAP
jgi:TrmH family RNA methyltransferase